MRARISGIPQGLGGLPQLHLQTHLRPFICDDGLPEPAACRTWVDRPTCTTVNPRQMEYQVRLEQVVSPAPVEYAGQCSMYPEEVAVGEVHARLAVVDERDVACYVFTERRIMALDLVAAWCLNISAGPRMCTVQHISQSDTWWRRQT